MTHIPHYLDEPGYIIPCTTCGRDDCRGFHTEREIELARAAADVAKARDDLLNAEYYLQWLIDHPEQPDEIPF